jgi:hypothetical protein
LGCGFVGCAAGFWTAVLGSNFGGGQGLGGSTFSFGKSAGLVFFIMSDAQNSLRRAIWSALLTAEFNSRYWDYLLRRFNQADFVVRLILAVAGCTAIAGWGFWRSHDIWWRAITTAATLLSTVILPVLKWHRLIPVTSTVRSNWIGLKNDYENLLHDLDGGEDERGIENRFRQIRKKDQAAEAEPQTLPHYKRLMDRCWQEVIMFRNLESA